MKDKDSHLIWEGYDDRLDNKHHRAEVEKMKRENPQLAYMRAKAKREMGARLTDDDQAELAKFEKPTKEAEQPSGWEDQGLQELEPNELLEYISKALPKFLQTHFNPEDYDEIRSKLYSAAELLQTPYGPDWYDHPGR